MKKIIIAVAISTIMSQAYSEEMQKTPNMLPVQKIESIEPSNQELPNNTDNQQKKDSIETTLSDIERANISDIYNKKIDYPQFEMGMRYYMGTYGLTSDFDKAIYWFSNSSKDEANAKADMMLAAMYYQGQGFSKDKQKALNFYSRAGNRGLLDAQLILTGLYFFNEELMNQEYANYWIYKAIDNSSEIAEILKTMIMVNGDDFKTVEKLVPMYTVLASKKDPNANFILGYLYFTGKGVQQDFERAKSYLTVAAQSNNPIAIVMIEEIVKFEQPQENQNQKIEETSSFNKSNTQLINKDASVK